MLPRPVQTILLTRERTQNTAEQPPTALETGAVEHASHRVATAALPMAATQPGAGWTESAPLQDAGSPRTHAQARARDGTLNTSSNIVLLYRMHELRGLAFVNFVLALLCYTWR